MYDNDHHPADVVGGALLGGGLAVRLQVVSSTWGWRRRTASLRCCRLGTPLLRSYDTLLWPLHAPCTRPMHHVHAHAHAHVHRCSSTLRGSPGFLSHARTVRAAPHGGTMRAVACKWGRSKGEERGSIARGGLSGDMEGYQMISGPVDCGVTSVHGGATSASARVCVMR